MILLGITAVFGVVEAVLYGIAGFLPKDDKGNPLLDSNNNQVIIEILVAAMVRF
jgi:hypothetical protein